jgi:hypothetical protein
VPADKADIETVRREIAKKAQASVIAQGKKLMELHQKVAALEFQMREVREWQDTKGGILAFTYAICNKPSIKQIADGGARGSRILSNQAPSQSRFFAPTPGGLPRGSIHGPSPSCNDQVCNHQAEEAPFDWEG